MSLGYESCYASLGLLPMQVYTLDVDLWHTWFMQVHTFRFKSMTYVVLCKFVTLAYASFRRKTLFTHASSPLMFRSSFYSMHVVMFSLYSIS